MSNEMVLKVGAMPDLYKAEENAVSLTSEYLDVDELEKGHKIRCFYLGVHKREQEDQESGEVKELECVQIAEQMKDGSIRMLESAARQLVGTLKDKENSGHVVVGKTPLQITYKGKKKNKTNGFSSAKWDIRLLIIADDK